MYKRFNQCFLNNKLRISVEGIRDGKSINMKTFWNIKVPSPPIGEQRRIADFLCSIDSRIAFAEREYNTFEKLRFGLMQQLFI